MFKSLFSLGAISSLLIASFVVSPARAAKRCPVEPPSTILSLYKSSDVVYVGKFDKSVEGDVVSSEENYRSINVSDHFSVSSTLKGETRKFFVRERVDYRYTTTETESEEERESDDEDSPSLKTGDSVILFLKYAEEEDDEKPIKKGKRPLELAHYRDGVKKIGASELSSYEARLRELKGIFSSSKNGNYGEVLNWIIRTIEDPVTRWDGAYELLTSFESLDWKKESEKEVAASQDDEDAAESDVAQNEDEADIDTPESAEDVEEEEPEAEDEFDNSVYATLLTDAQRSRLLSLAISSKPAKASKDEAASELSKGDRILFNLVTRWGDTKLAAAMLDRLNATGDDNYEKSNWMSSIAEILKDKDLSAISSKFSDVTYQADDEEMFASKDDSENEVKDGPAVQPAKSEETKTESSEPATNKADADAAEKSEKQTYKQYRDELLADFVSKAMVIISQETEKGKGK